MSNKSISNLSVGEFGLIEGIVPGENQYYRQRLLAQGVIPGEVLKIKRIAPFGDPIEVRYSIVDGNKTVDNLSAKDALSKATQICNAFLSNKKVTDKTVLDCVTTKVKFKTYRIIN